MSKTVRVLGQIAVGLVAIGAVASSVTAAVGGPTPNMVWRRGEPETVVSEITTAERAGTLTFNALLLCGCVFAWQALEKR